MKKTFLLFVALVCFFQNELSAQIKRIATSAATINAQIPGYNEVITYPTLTINYTPSSPPNSPTPIDEDSTTEDDKVYHYADNITTNISIADGAISNTTVGKVWTLRISIPNALNIGLSFSQLNLSPAAEMYIFNEGRTVLDTAIRQSNFINTNDIGLFPFKGNSIILYIVELNNFGSFLSSFQIPNVQAGFQDMDDVGDQNSGLQQRPSITCDPMIQCQPDKLTSARAVARFISNGYAGTGTLLNNESNNGRAFFLTAFHVIDVGGGVFGGPNGVIDPDEEAALATSVFQFQFWRTTCNGTINNTFLQFSGATIRASWKNSDVVLLELTSPPGIGDRVNYAGWSRQTTAPSDYNSYIIHHPQAQDMRVTKTRNVRDWFWNNMFWTAHYSSGTVDKGSSGSALFNEAGQVVGQLRSGWSNCNFTDFGDRYGKFNHSWNGAGLQPWLSSSQGLSSINTLVLFPLTITGDNFVGCGSNHNYTVPNLLGCSYTWAVSSDLNIVSGQGTPSIAVNGISPSGTNGWVQVTITDSKGWNRIVTVRLDVTVGLITPTITSQKTSAVGEPTTYQFTARQLSNTTYNWYVNNVLQQSGLSNTYDLYFPCRSTKTVKAQISNNCGTSGFSNSISQTGECIRTNSFVVSPNPATSQISVLTSQVSPDAANFAIDQIRVYDQSGTMKMFQSYNRAKATTLNISNLPTGTYFIEIVDRDYKERKQLLIL